MKEINDTTMKTLINNAPIDKEQKKELIELIPEMTQLERSELIVNLMIEKATDDIDELENLPIDLDNTSSEDVQKMLNDYDLKKKMN